MTTIREELADAPPTPSEASDCVICTQSLQWSHDAGRDYTWRCFGVPPDSVVKPATLIPLVLRYWSSPYPSVVLGRQVSAMRADGDCRLPALLKGYGPDESLARRLPDTLPPYGLIQDTIDAAVFHHRGSRAQGGQAQARLRLACGRT